MTSTTAAEHHLSNGAVPDGAMRCTTADRERTAGRLHEAAGDGRLTMEETDERLGQAYAARYHYELEALTTDLAPADPGPTGWALVATQIRRQLLDDLAILLGRAPGTRAQRLRILLVLIAVLAFAVGVVSLAMHGVFAGEHGPEHGYHFDRD
jgi:Domain of unknown function (DUF1707)